MALTVLTHLRATLLKYTEHTMLRSFPRSRFALRHFSRTSRTAQDISRVPLSVALPSSIKGVVSSAPPSHTPFNSQLSTLDNGLRIASEEHYGDYCTIGLAIEGGSRYEAAFPLGTSHLVEKLAYGKTSKHGGKDEIYGVLESCGGLIDCQSTKDTFIYAASCHVSGLDKVMEILANAVWRPQITEDEFEEAKQIVMYENDDMAGRIDCEPLLTDWIHKAAFNANTLGFSKFTADEALPKISREHVFSYISQYHRPERIVVAGVGVSHGELRSSIEKHFDWNTTTWASNPGVLLPKVPEIDHSLAQYTGGEFRLEKDLSMLAVGTPYPNLAHTVLGFESAGYKDDDFVAFCVLQSLLGGGGSFSAGGPGKGMYTRLYTEVMNQCHWIYGATAYNHSYADSGVFCIQASTEPKMLNDALIVIAHQFLRLLEKVDVDELKRAKIQLQSQLMMNLEIRPVMFEDLARQVIGHGRRRPPAEYMEQIDKVSAEDILRIGHKMLSGRPSLVGYGEIDTLTSLSALDEAIVARDLKKLVKKTKVFSWQ